jgi:hypothetical protein
MTDPIWCVMPVLAGPAMTEAAISDLLAQSVPTRILVINQGVDDAFRDRLERLAEQDSRIFVWHHQPPLPSLSASWNLALETVWHSGGDVALVVNNDVRLHPRTVQILHTVLNQQNALFVTAVGVREAEFDPTRDYTTLGTAEWMAFSHARGGPDFSCFLISRDCHHRFQFDEHFIPAFCEDLDYHRRLLLAKEGSRIFSVNLPYLHLASQTLKLLPAPEAERIRGAIEHQSRAYYAKKWGGPVNQERFVIPFGGGFSEPDAKDDGSATTPALQAWSKAQETAPSIEELNQRMMNLTEVKQPQTIAEALGPDLFKRYAQVTEELDGEDARGTAPERPADSESETF